ncbi:MAG: ABC transporter ATP-binding protein [Gemmatimonadaceae bacterium]
MAASKDHDDDTLGRAYDARLMRRLVVYVRPYGVLVAVSLVLLFIDGGLQLVGPLLTRQVIDVAIPAGDASGVRRAAIIFAVSLVAQFACSYGETILTTRLGQNVMRDLRRDIFAHLQRLSIAFFDTNPAGRLITRVTSDVETLNELFTSGVVAGLGDLFTLLAIGALMIVVDWRLAVAAFAVVPLVYLTSVVFQRAVRDTYRTIRGKLARINSFLQERITGIRVVQLFGCEAEEGDRFSKLNREHLDAHLRSITVYALYFPVIELLTTLALASLIVASASRVHAGALTVGVVAAFLQLVRRFFQPLQDLSEKYNTLQQAMASSERIFQLLDTEPAAAGCRTDTGSQARRAARSVPAGVSVRFDDVWFAYGSGHTSAEGRRALPTGEPEWVLSGVSFDVEAGSTVAIVGHTGAGKTTIVNLLLRFYDPERGRILVNGTDIRDLPLAELRSLIGYVQQDLFLFAADAETNIRLSSPIEHDRVVAAARQAHADRVIDRLPSGYATSLGERGLTLSVGERQLLSFARAIAADPALLILDEATRAVDGEIEAEIQRGMTELMRGRTTIAIAHRLSTIVEADEILVMHHGRLRERGTHRDLVARGGLYERLYRLQSGTGPPMQVAGELARALSAP